MIFYNENNPYAVAWLSKLVVSGLIAPGSVIDADIKTLDTESIKGATQFHAFAGIGVWSYALRLARWPDDAPVWTGSCPCQPFSIAGESRGASDERHLWPAWHRLITECKPFIIFGEQVASPAGRTWLDAVSTDLEVLGYAVGAADLCAAGVGAPHLRQRLYWVAHRNGARLEKQCEQQARRQRETVERDSSLDVLADAEGNGRGEGCTERGRSGDGIRTEGPRRGPPDDGNTVRVEHADIERAGGDGGSVPGAQEESPGARFGARRIPDELITPGATGGAWQPAEWWLCRDGFARPAEPGAFPLSHGATARVGRLRAYGNTIVPQVAATFIEAVMQWLEM